LNKATNKGGDKRLEVTDYELVQKCLSGNQGSFAEIVARYKKLIYNVVYNFIGNSPDLKDLFQEVFLRVYKSLANYNPDYQFSTWVVKIAANVCLDQLRRKRAEQMTMEDITEVSDNRPNPEDQYIARERLEKIRKAVQELPEDYRILVILFHQQELSYEAMGQILDQPITIIKNRLYRARLMLRDKLSVDKKGETSSL